MLEERDPERPMPRSAGERQTLAVAGGTAMIGLAACVLLVTWLVPWDAVPGGMPGPLPVGSVFSEAQVDRAEDFARWARLWSWSSLVVSLAVACWLGFGARGRDLVARVRGWWWWRALVLVVVLSLVGRAATLPFAIAYRKLSIDAGLTTSSWSSWALDLLKAELVAVFATALPVLAVLGCARRWRRAWPAAAGAVLGAMVVLGSFVYPVLVEPLFNTFTPLADGPLRTEIMEVAAEEGVEIDDVLVADASRRTTTLNAYVSGFGSSKRVVLYDTLVDDVPRDQVVVVVAHELAHARHDDVLLGTLIGAAGGVAAGGLLALITDALARRGRPDADDAASVPQLLALAAVAAFLVLPVQNGISRQLETRADVTALQATEDPAPFVALQRRLALRALADPTPPGWAQWWFGSHPTVLQRVALAERAEPGDARRPRP